MGATRGDGHAAEQEGRVALEVDQPPEREDDVRRGHGRPVGEADVTPEVEGVRLRVRGGPVAPRCEQDRLRDVAAPEGQQRVVDAAVHDRRGRLERPLRVGRPDLEGAVDDQGVDGRTRRPCRGPVGRRWRRARLRRAAPPCSGPCVSWALLPSRWRASSLLGRCGLRQAPRLDGRRRRRLAGRLQPARRRPARRELDERRLLHPAAVEDVGAARWKRQPGGGRDGSGTSPGSASGSVPAPSARGTAPISASVYGWSGDAQSACVGAVSTILPRYMTATVVGDVADDREVVRDEEEAEVELARERAEQVRDLGLRRGVERRQRLVEHDHRRLARRARGRSRSAGAARRRTRADSRARRSRRARPGRAAPRPRADAAPARHEAERAQRLADLLADACGAG